MTGDNGYERAIALVTIGQRGDRNLFCALAMDTIEDGLGEETLFALAGMFDSVLVALSERTGVAHEELLRAVAIAVIEDPNNN